MTTIDTKAIVARYDEIAHANRPDWSAFVAEAHADGECMYEILDTAEEVVGRPLTDAERDVVWDAAVQYVGGLRA